MYNDVKKLGFGLMRLPKTADGNEDFEKVCEMADYAIKNGYKYFDTAYVYDNGLSEKCVKEVLTKRHARDEFYVATKLPSWEMKCKEDCQRIFDEQLSRTGLEYFDFYLLHALGKDSLPLLDKYGAWEFCENKKREGAIKNLGFSFHDTAEVLDEILTAHPNVDFVQLQLNYLDWENEKVQSRKCYKTARAHGKKIVVMEPVKGGLLANLNGDAEKLFENLRDDGSDAAKALRYVGTLDGILVVLSGMSTMAQMVENVSTFDDMKPLSSDEREIYAKVADKLLSIKSIPCTACKYCVDGCPKKIEVPKLFRLYNENVAFPNDNLTKGKYSHVTQGHGKASDCISCGKCENVCPQKIEIRKNLKEIATRFE